jgi:hypothetical protein
MMNFSDEVSTSGVQSNFVKDSLELKISIVL